MELKKILITIGIILGIILVYKLVPLTIKKFIFFLFITLTIFYMTYQFFDKKISGGETP